AAPGDRIAGLARVAVAVRQAPYADEVGRVAQRRRAPAVGRAAGASGAKVRGVGADRGRGTGRGGVVLAAGGAAVAGRSAVRRVADGARAVLRGDQTLHAAVRRRIAARRSGDRRAVGAGPALDADAGLPDLGQAMQRRE